MLPLSFGFSNDVTSVGRGGIKFAGAATEGSLKATAATSYAASRMLTATVGGGLELIKENTLMSLGFTQDELQAAYEFEQTYRELIGMGTRFTELTTAYATATQKIQNLLVAGETIRLRRETLRQRAAAVINGYRTKDLTFRTFRNEALVQYRTLFDLAGRYSYLAAKSYDYETGLLGTTQGQAVINRLVASRSLGDLTGGEPQATTSTPARPAPAGTQATVLVQSVRITGAEGLATQAELNAVVQSAIGQQYDFAGLEQLAEQVSRYLAGKGWLLASAYLPQQDLTNGALEIAVQQSRIEGNATGDGVQIKPGANLRLDPDRIRKTVGAAVFQGNTQTPHSDTLERAVLLINDLPGIYASSYLARGSSANTTQIGMEANEGALLSGNAWVDNYGNRYTGAWRTSVMGSLNNPSRQGDQATLMLTAANGTQLGRVGYSLPLGYSGLRAQASASSMSYQIGEDQAEQNSTGKSDTFGLGLSYPLVRKRESNLSVSLNYDNKALQDKTAGTVSRDKQVDNLSLGLSGDRYDRWQGGGLNNFMLNYTSGQLNLDRVPGDASNDKAGAQTQGSFQKLSYTLARLQRVTEQTSLFAAINGQAATQNLDSSEKFILGGPSGVRAYPGGEASGDRGWIGNIEIRRDLPQARTLGWGDVQVLGFYDVGHIGLQAKPWMAAPNATASNSYTLEGVGVGLNISKPGKYTVRLSWSQALGDNPGRNIANDANSDGLKDKQRLWFFASINL